MEVPKEEGFVTIVENHLLKKILKEGEGGTPTKGQQVFALYRGTLTNGDEFDKNQDRDEPFKFTIGTGQVIKGWDQGFATMKKGQKAILVCSPDFAYGKSGSGKIPADATLHFEVELLDFKDKKKEKYEMPDEEKIAEAAKLKDQGNLLLKEGKVKQAAKAYQDAIDYLDDIQKPEALQLLQASRLNSALAYLKTKEYPKAAKEASEVLKKDPNNPKALFRRGNAYLQLQNYQDSRADLQALLKLEPNNHEAKHALNRLLVEVKKAKAKEKKVFAKIFSDNYYADMKPEKKETKEQDYKPVESSSDDQESKPKKKQSSEKKMEVEEPTPPDVDAPATG